MVRSRAFLALTLIFLTATSSAVAQRPVEKGEKYAFLVACSAYDPKELRPLPYTINDILEFRKALLATGFADDHIVVMHDRQSNRRFLPEAEKIREEMALFLGALSANDTVVVALSGHGIHFKNEKTGYFCPVDARLESKAKLLPMDGPGSIFEHLKNCKAARKLLIANACRNDPTSDLAMAARKAQIDDNDDDKVPPGIAAIYSCGVGEKSYYDPDARRGLFFLHLTEAWRGAYHAGAGPLTLEDVFTTTIAKTKNDVYRRLGAKQVPITRREYVGSWMIQDRVAAARPDASAGVDLFQTGTVWRGPVSQKGVPGVTGLNVTLTVKDRTKDRIYGKLAWKNTDDSETSIHFKGEIDGRIITFKTCAPATGNIIYPCDYSGTIEKDTFVGDWSFDPMVNGTFRLKLVEKK